MRKLEEFQRSYVPYYLCIRWRVFYGIAPFVLEDLAALCVQRFVLSCTAGSVVCELQALSACILTGYDFCHAATCFHAVQKSDSYRTRVSYAS